MHITIVDKRGKEILSQPLAQTEVVYIDNRESWTLTAFRQGRAIIRNARLFGEFRAQAFDEGWLRASVGISV